MDFTILFAVFYSYNSRTSFYQERIRDFWHTVYVIAKHFISLNLSEDFVDKIFFISLYHFLSF